jgi:glycine cleavage system H protein
MEGSTYQNIFETKGIEYLVIIAFFAVLIPFWIVLNRQVKINRLILSSFEILKASALRIPQGLFFSRFHTWTHLDKAGLASVGLDDLLLHLTGPVQFRPVRNTGETIGKGEILAEIEHDGKVLSILSPISGEITSLNSELKENPDQLSIDPYTKGWMFKIRPSAWIEETQSYFLAEEAKKWSENELNRFKDFLGASLVKHSPYPEGIVLQDGGEIADQPLASLPAEVWHDFQEEFLK